MIYKMCIKIFDTNNQAIIKTKLEINNNNYHSNLKIFETR